jgi:MFS family permease
VQNLAHVSSVGPVHSVFTKNQKRFIVFMASFGGFFSPISANIYFPALNALALDLGVTSTLINLTLTSYMVCHAVKLFLPDPISHPPIQIFQGLAPSVIGNLADNAGRRPAYIICFVIYIGANVGLALQNNYAALFVLRCIQSSGSSGTIALSSGVVSDIATVSERGKYLGFITAGSLLGPAVGPVVGGVLVRQGPVSQRSPI